MSDLLIVGVLLATVALRFVFIVAFAYLVLPRGTNCPHCAAPLSEVRAGWLAWLAGVERRFCLECGWSGIVRRARRAGRAGRAASSTGPAGPT